MYNKYIFINNNRRKKQKELEEKKKLEDSQISFDMMMNGELKQENEKFATKILKNENVNQIQTENFSNKMENDCESSNIVNSSRKQFGSLNKKGKNLTKFVDDYVLVDIETTGLSPVEDDIIEIGAIKVKDNKMIDTYSQLIKIDRILPEFITNLTGITDEMLQTGKMPDIVLNEFVDFVGTNVIIGHNVNFDLGFLINKCKKYLNYNLSNDYIDTLYMARRLVPNSVNYKLGTLAKLFNISYAGAHRGLKDVEITYEVYNNLRKLK